MDPQISAAWIALVGITVSVIASLFGSFRLINTEMRKLRAEIEQTYASKLIEARLQTYPELYGALSGTIRTIQFDTLTKENLTQLQSKMENWALTGSLFASAETGLVFHRLRIYLQNLLQMSDSEFQSKVSTIAGLKEIRNNIHQLELALKYDLGIYIVEFSDRAKRFESYQEITDFLQSEAKQ